MFFVLCRYTYEEVNASVHLDLKKKGPETDQTFYWSFRWKDKKSEQCLHQFAPFSITITCPNELQGQLPCDAPWTWFGFLDLMSSTPTTISDDRGEWRISVKAVYQDLPLR